jgi:general secretion pathway protein M
MFERIRNSFERRMGDGAGSTIREQWRRSSVHQWLKGLAPRDRLVVNLVSILVMLALTYTFIWQPVANWRASADTRHVQAVEVHEWIAANQLRLQAAGRAGGERQGGSLLSLVANSAASSGIQLTRVQPEGQDGVSIVIQEQEFNQVLRWLDQLTNREQLTIRQLSIDGQASPGRISARISFG